MSLSDKDELPPVGPGHNSGARILDDEHLPAIGDGAAQTERKKASVSEAVAAIKEFGLAKGVDATFARACGDPRLEAAHFRLLLAHATCMNPKTGLSFPSDELLADATGISLKTVQNSHTELVTWEYLVRPDRRTKEGREEQKGATSFVRPTGLTWQELHRLTRSLQDVASMRKAIMENILTDFIVTARAAANTAEKHREEAACNSPSGGNPNASNSPIGGNPGLGNSPTGRKYFPIGKCTSEKPSKIRGGKASLIIEDEQPNEDNNPRKKIEVGSKTLRATSAAASSDLDDEKLVRGGKPDSEERDAGTPSKDADRQGVPPSDQSASARTQEPPPQSPAPATAVVVLGVSQAPSIDGGMFGNGISLPREHILGAIAACGIELAKQRPEIAQEIERQTMVKMRLCAAQWMDTEADAAAGDKEAGKKLKRFRNASRWWEASWQENHRKDLLKLIEQLKVEREAGKRSVAGNSARLTLYGDRDVPSAPDFKKLHRDVANRALERAFELCAGSMSIRPADCEAVCATFEDRTAGWEERLALTILTHVVGKAVKPAPTGLAEELVALAPTLPRGHIDPLATIPFSQPWMTSIEWPVYDPATSPAKIADALRQAMPTIEAKWHVDRLVETRKALFDKTKPQLFVNQVGALAGEIERALEEAGFDTNKTVDDWDSVYGVADIASRASEAPATRAEDLIDFVRTEMQALLDRHKPGARFEWSPKLPSPPVRFGKRSPLQPPKPRKADGSIDYGKLFGRPIIR